MGLITTSLDVSSTLAKNGYCYIRSTDIEYAEQLKIPWQDLCHVFRDLPVDPNLTMSH